MKCISELVGKAEEIGRVGSGNKETNPWVGLANFLRIELKTRYLCLNDILWAAGNNNSHPLFIECLCCIRHSGHYFTYIKLPYIHQIHIPFNLVINLRR